MWEWAQLEVNTMGEAVNAFAAAMMRPMGKRAGPGEAPYQNAKRQRGLADGDAHTMEAE